MDSKKRFRLVKINMVEFLIGFIKTFNRVRKYFNNKADYLKNLEEFLYNNDKV